MTHVLEKNLFSWRKQVGIICVAAAILKKLQECDCDVQKLHGQGHDGASVMSGNVCIRF